MARGRLMLELGRSAEAIEACRAALDARPAPGERAQALIASAAGMRLSDRIDEGLAALDEAEPLADGAALELELSRLHHLRGNLLFPLGRHADCLREHELARQHARAGGLAGGRGRGARRARRRLLPSRAHAVGAPAVPRVRGAGPPARLRPPRGREPADGGLVGDAPGRDRRRRRRRPRGDRPGAAGVAAARRADGARPRRLGRMA